MCACCWAMSFLLRFPSFWNLSPLSTCLRLRISNLSRPIFCSSPGSWIPPKIYSPLNLTLFHQQSSLLICYLSTSIWKGSRFFLFKENLLQVVWLLPLLPLVSTHVDANLTKVVSLSMPRLFSLDIRYSFLSIKKYSIEKFLLSSLCSSHLFATILQLYPINSVTFISILNLFELFSLVPPPHAFFFDLP